MQNGAFNFHPIIIPVILILGAILDIGQVFNFSINSLCSPCLERSERHKLRSSSHV